MLLLVNSSGMSLDPTLVSRLAAIALSHVTREYPNKPDHVLTRCEDAQTPRALHPVFYGSFDWHSCVHSHWLLATLLRLYPEIPEAFAIRELFDNALTPARIAGECAYLTRPASASFERPYGWAWLLALQSELLRHAAGGAHWSAAAKPLAALFVQKFHDWLPRATYPVRTGTHGNTAFALRLAFGYAQAAEDHQFSGLLRSTAIRWYSADTDCQCWEPSGEDFLSPSLVEAQCMAAALGSADFRVWFARFLPHLARGHPASLFEPALVSDRSDGRIVHLDGLNLSRAWSWFEIAASLDSNDPVRTFAAAAGESHLAAGLPTIAGDYMGEHWLATYALLALLSAEHPGAHMTEKRQG
jgi:hypothetical protein